MRFKHSRASRYIVKGAGFEEALLTDKTRRETKFGRIQLFVILWPHREEEDLALLPTGR